MKRNILSAGLLTLLFSVAFCQFTPAARAQSQNRLQAAQGEQAQQQPAGQAKKMFTGQVIKAQNGKYALLTDKAAGKGFFLDDQDKAKQFEGKDVKVVGTLDVATNTIHISDIQPA